MENEDYAVSKLYNVLTYLTLKLIQKMYLAHWVIKPPSIWIFLKVLPNKQEVAFHFNLELPRQEVDQICQKITHLSTVHQVSSVCNFLGLLSFNVTAVFKCLK